MNELNQLISKNSHSSQKSATQKEELGDPLIVSLRAKWRKVISNVALQGHTQYSDPLRRSKEQRLFGRHPLMAPALQSIVTSVEF